MKILAAFFTFISAFHLRKDYKFNIELNGQEHQFHLKPNTHEIIGENALVQRISGQSVSYEAINIRSYKGRITSNNGTLLGWARFIDSPKGLHGSFKFGQDTFHVTKKSRFDFWKDKLSTYSEVNNMIVVKDAYLSKNKKCETKSGQENLMPSPVLEKRSTLLSHSSCPSTRKVLHIGVVADCTYVRMYGKDTIGQILSDFNSVNQVYEAQLNVNLQISKIILFDSCDFTGDYLFNAPCSTWYSIEDRLSDFSAYISNNSEASLWHLLTQCYTGEKVGLSWKNTLCMKGTSKIYSPDVSGKYSTIASTSITSVSMFDWMVIAHEIGHNFGASHDCDDNSCSQCTQQPNGQYSCQDCVPCEPDCSCKAKYLMNPYARSSQSMFSPNSVSAMCVSIAKSGRCLIDAVNDTLPDFSINKCGNWIKDEGEECDCGPVSSFECQMDQCCDPKTCKLVPDAVCDDFNDPCCSGCNVKPRHTFCRQSIGYCDISEFCDGVSPSCPVDSHRQNGDSCPLPDGSTGSCLNGDCTSRTYQCKLKGILTGVVFSSNFVGECVGYSNLCEMYCQDQSGNCVSLKSQFIDGTPCGYNNLGTCTAGQCLMNKLDTSATWMTDHLATFAALITFLSVLLLVICIKLLDYYVLKNKGPKVVKDKLYPVYTFLNATEKYDVVKDDEIALEPANDEYSSTRNKTFKQKEMDTINEEQDELPLAPVKKKDKKGHKN